MSVALVPYDPHTAALFPFDPRSLGVDVRLGFNDLSPVWGTASGLDCLGQDIIGRITCDPGGLFYDTDYGYNVLNLINASLTQAQLQKEQQAMALQVELDPRIRSAKATFTFDNANEQLFIDLRCTLVTGSRFDLVLLANQLTVNILSVNGVLQPSSPANANPGVQFVVGPPGADGPPGIQGPAGASGTPQLTLDFDENEPSTSSGNEDLAYERMVNFGALPGSVTVDLTAMVSSSAGTAVFNVRVGGTPGVANSGSIVATFSTASPGLVALEGSGPFTNPGGLLAVKVTMKSSAPGATATMSDRVVTVR